MRNYYFFNKITVLFCALFLLQNAVWSNNYTKKNYINVGNWTISLNQRTRKVDFIKNGETILRDIFVKAKIENEIINSSQYTHIYFSNNLITDEIDSAQKFIIEYSHSGKPTIQQIFYLYPNKDFFITEVTISDTKKFRTNYIAPIISTSCNQFLPESENNRFLTIPYDNDGFITYGSFPLNTDSLSFEVTSIFNGDSQKGLVIGSIDHDTWKSAIRIKSSENKFIKSLECYSGATHAVTRDYLSWKEGDTEQTYLMPHGFLENNNISSSRFLVGFFSDWRNGMETFGEINEKVTPKQKWIKGVPFGWNSWGGMYTHVNYKGVISVSDFIKNNLQQHNFTNDNTVYVGLDSYWDNMNETELKSFADHCYANGQTPGIYWTPFCDWYGSSREIEGSVYNYADTWLKAKGTARSLCGAKCMDPTHPGTYDRMKFFINKFINLGFKYIKLDFMTNGAVEADSYYNNKITTGTQAYNDGMQKLKKLCGDDVFLVLSISPVFPAQFAHARRISCDAWGEMWHTQYMMNSLSFGWWLDRIYVFNDADHLVLSNRSAGENRARITSGAITGIFMLGDNLSSEGNYTGTTAEYDKVIEFATNPFINDIAKIKKSFRPAYGHLTSSASGAVDLFICETNDSYYIAYFNYGTTTKAGELDLAELGFEVSNIESAFECWKNTITTLIEGKLTYSIPGEDVEVFKIIKKRLDNFL